MTRLIWQPIGLGVFVFAIMSTWGALAIAQNEANPSKVGGEIGKTVGEVKSDVGEVATDVAVAAKGVDSVQQTFIEINARLEELASLRAGKKISGATILLILFLGSYCVQRFSNFLIRMLGCLSWWDQWLAEPAKEAPKHEKEQYRIKHAVAYYVVATVVAIGLVAWFKFATNGTPLLEGLLSFSAEAPKVGDSAGTSVFRSLGDSSLMVLVLLIGADQIAQWILPNSQEGAEMVDVSGKLVLNEPTKS